MARTSTLQAPSGPPPQEKRPGPRGSRQGLVAFAIILLLATIAVPFSGLASTSRAGNSISVPSTETIVGDFNAVGRDITVEGIVEGDANLAAIELHIPGRIDGSASIAAASGDISGTIGGSLRIASGTIELTGTTNGSLVVIAGSVTIPSQARIQGDVLVYGGQVDIRGTVGGSVKITGGNATIGGRIDGNVNASVSQLDLLDTARIGGALSYTSQSSAGVAPNAVVTGTTTHDKPLDFRNPLGIFNGLLKVVWALVAGALLVAFAPRAVAAIGQEGRKLLPAGILGVLAMVLVPIGAIVLMISFVGFPAGLMVLAGYIIIFYLSQVTVGIVIGRAILSGRWDDGSRGFYLLAMTIGVILISVLRFIPLPYVGAVVSVVVSIWGIGTMMLMLRRLRPKAVLAG